MPSHQERREPLPKEYQFGDAGKPAIRIRYVEQWDIDRPYYHHPRLDDGFFYFGSANLHLWHCAITQRPYHECTCGADGPNESADA